MKCNLCKSKNVHKPDCPSDKVFVSPMDNIDSAIEDEVTGFIKQCEENIKNHGFACLSNGDK